MLDLFDTFLYEIPDNRRGYGEKRTIAFGELEKQVYCLVYTLRGKSCRLITARRANERERKAYYSFLKGR
ncbi:MULTISPECIES: BrnT family toxin [unclassified Microcystis]|uniref:BrnT family toxin n=1 Tax=unclassified Microcystis TaxID=2643300 RepID=UPI00338E352A